MDRLLNVCEKWSHDNKATFSSTKSVSLQSSDGTDRMLYGKVLPVESCQKYLGVEVSSKGILWNTFVKSRNLKASKILGFCQSMGNGWPEAIKLQIYKTFIQPQLDYMGPALHVIHSLLPASTLNETSLFFQKSLSWIFGIVKCNSIGVLQSMTMLRNPTQRWYNLSSTFVARQNRISPHNPILSIQKELGCGPWSSKLIIPRMFVKTATLVQYERYVESFSILKKPQSFKTFESKKFIKELEQSFRLPNYIASASRKPQSYIDKCLLIKDKIQRNYALAWRRNVFNARKQCFVCQTPFRRSHVDTCNMLTGDNVPRQIQDGITRVNIYARNQRKSLSIIDRILNTQEWELAEICFNYIVAQTD